MSTITILTDVIKRIKWPLSKTIFKRTKVVEMYFSHWLLEIIQVNSYIIYKLANNHRKFSLKKFQQATATQLLEKAAALAGDEPIC